MAVRWVRCLVPFQTLSKTDQQLLLQESWKELFLLNFAQWSVPWDLATLFDSPQVRERIPDDPTTCVEMKTVQEILCRFRQLSPDSSEVGCMKAVILFSPGKIAVSDIRISKKQLFISNRNSSTVRRATGRDAAGSGPVHPLRSRSFALSASTDPLRPAPAPPSLAPSHSFDNNRDVILQGNHRQRSHLTSLRRYVHDGEIQQQQQSNYAER